MLLWFVSISACRHSVDADQDRELMWLFVLHWAMYRKGACNLLSHAPINLGSACG